MSEENCSHEEIIIDDDWTGNHWERIVSCAKCFQNFAELFPKATTFKVEMTYKPPFDNP